MPKAFVFLLAVMAMATTSIASTLSIDAFVLTLAYLKTWKTKISNNFAIFLEKYF